MGTEASRVQQNGAADQIEGGAARGANLFHSFEAFNVGQGRQVYFANPDGIEYIFSRVTGSSRSDILGTLGVLGPADLFLLNPNGVVFGPNARLDVNGSFLASSGDRILFPNGAEFSAVNPQTPPLLTIQTPIGLQYGSHPGPIRVEGPGNNLTIASETVPVDLDDRSIGLQAPAGETLALIGGEVSLAGGNLTAASGRIELGSVAGDSTVTLSPDPQGWRLGYETVENFRNIDLTEAALVDVSGTGAGSIRVRGRSISLRDGSALLAGTLGSGSGSSLIVQAEETIELSGANANGFVSTLQTDVHPGATGNSGNLILETGQLILRDGTFISASTFGQGDGGALTIRTTASVELSGLDGEGNSSRLLARVNSGGVGNAGNLTIETGQLILRNGGRVSASINGDDGDGGTLTIRATELVELSGVDGEGDSSRFLTRVNKGAAGNAGSLIIETGRLILRDGALITSSIMGQGDGGDLTIRASESVELSGMDSDGDSSRLRARVHRGAAGNAGALTIETGRLILRDGASVSSSTSGQGHGGALNIRATESVELSGVASDGDSSRLATQVNTGARGNAGDLTIETGQLIFRDGAFVSASTFGQGHGGDLTIRAAESVELSGRETLPDEDPSRLVTQVNRRATGNAGNLTIETGRLILRDGALVSASTSGAGRGGDLTIRATESVELSGVNSDGNSSRLQTQARSNSTEDAGALTIDTRRLILRDGALVSASTFSQGNGGDLTIRASESVELSGVENDGDPSRLVTQVNRGATGNAGALTIETGELMLQNGAIVSSSTFGQGNGGDLTIRAAESVELSGVDGNGDASRLRTQVREEATGNAGALTIETGRLILQDGALVLSETEGNGAAGDLSVRAADLIVVADGSVLSAETTGGGEVGKLTVSTDQLIVRDGGQLLVSGERSFPAGTLTIAADTILLINQARLSAETETGDQGDIAIHTENLLLRQGSRITTDATGDATGGDIFLAVDGSLILLDNSAIVARAESGPGGNIRITAQGLFQSPDSQIDASSQLGIDGVVDIVTPNINPTQGTVDLPETLAIPQLDQRCHAGGDASTSRFVSTGRGGLPPSPEGPLSSSGIWEDVRPPAQPVDSPVTNSAASDSLGSDPIVEAQGWRLNQQGQVVLLAEAQSERRCGG